MRVAFDDLSPYTSPPVKAAPKNFFIRYAYVDPAFSDRFSVRRSYGFSFNLPTHVGAASFATAGDAALAILKNANGMKYEIVERVEGEKTVTRTAIPITGQAIPYPKGDFAGFALFGKECKQYAGDTDHGNFWINTTELQNTKLYPSIQSILRVIEQGDSNNGRMTIHLVFETTTATKDTYKVIAP